ncbi:MAG: toprim domain-containing protein, partial [Clostridia bacterium]|nr:toprim domain-containing protein [Clostridia bacterium]
ALYEAGFKNAVASMGTSLTVEQARLLQRYTGTVVISYDGDAAGQHATFRGLQILKDAGLDVKVLSLPDGLDPDELIKKRGAAAYKKLIDEALPLIDYKLKVIENTFDVKTADGKRKYVDNALRVISESDKEFEREELLKRVSEVSRITYETLKRAVDKAPAGKTERFDVPINESTSAMEKAEKFVLYARIFNKPYAAGDISELEFSSDKRADVLDRLIDEAERGVKPAPSTIVDAMGEQYIDELNSIFMFGDSVSEQAAPKFYADCVKRIKERTLKGQIATLEEYFSSLTDVDERKGVLKLLQKKVDRQKTLKTEDK